MRHPGKGIEGGRVKLGLFHRKEYLGEMDLKSKKRERVWLTGSGKMEEKAGDNYVKEGWGIISSALKEAWRLNVNDKGVVALRVTRYTCDFSWVNVAWGLNLFTSDLLILHLFFNLKYVYFLQLLVRGVHFKCYSFIYLEHGAVKWQVTRSLS